MEHTQMPAYTVDALAADLRRIAAGTDDVGRILAQVRPLAQRLAGETHWVEPRFYDADPEQGFTTTLLHEEADHTLAVFAVSWLPGRGTPPHDHGTWGVVTGVDGSERNTFWKRVDDGSRPDYAELVKAGEKIVGEGDVLIMPADAIHTVTNETDKVTLSLHIYGRHIGFTGRRQFDPGTRTVKPFEHRIR